jgi:uncharacterized protein (TIGR03118 family)
VLGVLSGSAGSPAGASDGDHGHHHGRAFRQVNLVSDIEGMAQLTDPALRNPWGLVFGPTTPAWVNNQFNPASACPEDNPDCLPAPEDLLTKITLYAGANGQAPISKVPLEVQASSPTGIVFNPTSTFLIDQGAGPVPARFIFNENFVDDAGVAPEGRVTGWAPADPPPLTTTPTSAIKDPGLHFGLALVPGGHHRGARLLAADGLNGVIDVFNNQFQPVTRPGLFVDPRAAQQGLFPYNVTFLEGKVYVAYAGENRGAVSVFRANGRFEKRLVTSRRLVGPWGMAIAPRPWGGFGGDLLVGNVDDGRINAFDLDDGDFEGTLRDGHGRALVNPGLWGIAFGNGVIGTPRTLLFVAGIGEEVGGFGEEVYEHGLMGAIRPAGHRHHDD